MMCILALHPFVAKISGDKILHDIINTIVLLKLRKEYVSNGVSINEIVGKTQSLMCSRGKNGLVHVETPNKKTKEYYKILGVEVPSNVRIDSFKAKVLYLKNV